MHVLQTQITKKAPSVWGSFELHYGTKKRYQKTDASDRLQLREEALLSAQTQEGVCGVFYRQRGFTRLPFLDRD